MYAARILADSIPVDSDVRLTTIEATFPRIILAEANTHRELSRNSASSRAIPVERRIEQVRTNPFIPEAFTANKRGMQADTALSGRLADEARTRWLAAATNACDHAEALARMGVHKQHANRILEPFVWHTAVFTATQWANFFALRRHPAAQPEMQRIAYLMRDAMLASTPRVLAIGEWHLPYVDFDDEVAAAVPGAVELLWKSVARCAATSYDRQHVDKTLAEYRERHDDMARMGHWSPFEHQAKVGTREEALVYAMASPQAWREVSIDGRIGNFRTPWVQYRKTFPGEALFQG